SSYPKICSLLTQWISRRQKFYLRWLAAGLFIHLLALRMARRLEDASMRRFLLAVLVLSTLWFGSCARKSSTLNLLVWEGYADPSFVKAFEEQYHCKVAASYMGSSDELVAKLRGGSASNYDVISPSSDVATTITTAGLATPLDLSKI